MWRGRGVTGQTVTGHSTPVCLLVTSRNTNPLQIVSWPLQSEVTEVTVWPQTDPATHQQCLRKTRKLRVDPSFIGCFCSPGQSEGQRGHLIWPSLHAARIQVKDAVYLADGNVSESGNHSLLILVRKLTLGVVIYNTNNQPEIIRFNNARCLKSLEVQESRPVMLCTDASGAVFIIFTPNSSTRPVLKVTSM